MTEREQAEPAAAEQVAATTKSPPVAGAAAALPRGLLLRKMAQRLQRRAGGERDEAGVTEGAAAAVDRASSSSGQALPSSTRQQFEGSLGVSLGDVRVHTGAASQEAANATGSQAYTQGNDIHFAAGKYDPSSAAGQHLLAHEVAHTQQQGSSGGGATSTQHKLEVSMPGDSAEVDADRAADAMVAGATTSVGAAGSATALHRNPGVASPQQKEGGAKAAQHIPINDKIADLRQLRGQFGDNKAVTQWTDSTPAGTDTLLPWTPEGNWKAQEILGKLGQVDQIDDTDSDGVRCVQAVAIASHVLGGPSDVIGFIGTAVMSMVYAGAKMVGGKTVFATPTPRRLAAGKVLTAVQQNLINKVGTYGDLSWAQEALHDMAIEKDNKGTPANKVMDVITNSGAGQTGSYSSNQGGGSEGKKIDSVAKLAPEVDGLKDGEQLIATQIIKWTGVENNSGHQLVIYKTGTETWLYDPQQESTKTLKLGAGGKGLEGLFVKNKDKEKWILLAGKKSAPKP